MDDEKAYQVMDEVNHIAAVHNSSASHVALAWQLQQDVITSSIIGARMVDQLNELVGAVDLQLRTEEIETLNKISEGF